MSSFFLSTSNYSEDTFKSKIRFLGLKGDEQKIMTTPDVKMALSDFEFPSVVENLNGYYCLLDGHIYNHQELSNDLSGDILLVNQYRTKGEKMVESLNGGFSFVIYDNKNKIIFGARDRLGEKPLFYSLRGGNLDCSTSLKALCNKRYLTVNKTARDMYIKYGFIYDSACIFEGVNKLPAGHYFIYDLTTGSMKIKKYWDLDQSFYKPVEKPECRADAINYAAYLLEDAIRLRLPGHDFYGMGISSGTDSFAIYNFLRGMGIDLPLFNIIPNKDNGRNEYPMTARNIRLVNRNKEINACVLSEEDYQIGVNDYFKFYEEPNSDFSSVITDSLFRKMKEYDNKIKVAFSGTGAGSFFYGIPDYKKYYNNVKNYHFSYSILEGLCKEKIVVNDFSEILDQNDKRSMQRYEIKTYVPNLLIKEDIASSHNGIEVRSPFCDYRLVEYLNSLDLKYLCFEGKFKYILKQMILNRFKVNFFVQKKKGFFPDLTKITRIPCVKKDIFDTLTEENLDYFFPEISISKVKEKLANYDNHMNGKPRSSLLNLYFYIKMMLMYHNEVFQ